MASFREAIKLKDKIYLKMLNRPEVTGIGVGYANPKIPSKGAALIVYTHKNLSTTKKSSLKSMTSTIMKVAGATSSFPVRFIPTGVFRINPPARPAQIYRSRFRPVPGGVSIGQSNPPLTGTAGINVIRGSQEYILSNNHVLVRNNSPVFSETIQPGASDGGISGRDRVGRAFEFVPLRRTGPNFMDAAISIPDRKSLLNPRYFDGPSGRLIVVPGHLLSYRVGERFKKTGRTTGFVRGVVEAIGVVVDVDYSRLIPALGVIRFFNQTVISAISSRPITLPGDSGSVWLRERDNFAAAVTFAGSSDGLRSTSFPIRFAMQAFRTRVARPAGSNRFTAGAIKGMPPKNNFAYVQPLTKAELNQISVVKVNKFR